MMLTLGRGRVRRVRRGRGLLRVVHGMVGCIGREDVYMGVERESVCFWIPNSTVK